MYGPSKLHFKVSDKLKNESSSSNSMRSMVVPRSSPQAAFRQTMSPTMRAHGSLPPFSGYAHRDSGPLRVTIYEDMSPMKIRLASREYARCDIRDDSAIALRHCEEVPILRKYGRSHSTHELIDYEDRTGGVALPHRVRFDIVDDEIGYAPCDLAAKWNELQSQTQARPIQVDCDPNPHFEFDKDESLRAKDEDITCKLSRSSILAALIGDQTLLKSAKEGRFEILHQLIALNHYQKEDINATDNSGRTALSYIAAGGCVRALEDLLTVPGVEVNKPDNEGNTPLHFAAQAGQAEIVNFLLCRCSDIEIDPRNNLGFTPLMKAALQGRTKCAKLLLCAGASPIMRDTGRGLRAEQWARFCGRYVCAEVIEKFARNRLLERTTAYGRWGSDSDLGPRLVNGKLQPPAVVLQNQVNQTSIKSRLRKAFRTTSHPVPGASNDKNNFSLVTQLTSAALCASSPVLPSSTRVPPIVKSLIRPLTVPKVQVTSVAEQDGFQLSPVETVNRNSMTKPPPPVTAKLKKKK